MLLTTLLFQVQFSSWPRWKILLVSFPYNQRMWPFLPSCSWMLAEAWGDVAEEWNLLAELCGKTCPVRLLALFPDPELWGSLAEITDLSCRMPVCQGLLSLTRGREINALLIPWLCPPRMRNPLSPLTFGGCLVRPMLTQTWDFGMGPPAGGNSSCHYQCFVLQSHK